MADNTQNKSLEQLIQAFTVATNQTKELDTAISEFSGVTKSFNETLTKMDKHFPIKEMANLSNDALNKLKEVKAYNEYQIFDKLESIINKSLSAQFRELENKLKDSNREQLNELKKSLGNIEVTSVGSTGSDEKYDEIINLLQGMSGSRGEINIPQQIVEPNIQTEEYQRLARRIDKLVLDFRNMEVDYENRIAVLEEEIRVLRGNKGQHIDLSEPGLPF